MRVKLRMRCSAVTWAVATNTAVLLFYAAAVAEAESLPEKNKRARRRRTTLAQCAPGRRHGEDDRSAAPVRCRGSQRRGGVRGRRLRRASGAAAAGRGARGGGEDLPGHARARVARAAVRGAARGPAALPAARAAAALERHPRRLGRGLALPADGAAHQAVRGKRGLPLPQRVLAVRRPGAARAGVVPRRLLRGGARRVALGRTRVPAGAVAGARHLQLPPGASGLPQHGRPRGARQLRAEGRGGGAALGARQRGGVRRRHGARAAVGLQRGGGGRALADARAARARPLRRRRLRQRHRAAPLGAVRRAAGHGAPPRLLRGLPRRRAARRPRGLLAHALRRGDRAHVLQLPLAGGRHAHAVGAGGGGGARRRGRALPARRARGAGGGGRGGAGARHHGRHLARGGGRLVAHLQQRLARRRPGRRLPGAAARVRARGGAQRRGGAGGAQILLRGRAAARRAAGRPDGALHRHVLHGGVGGLGRGARARLRPPRVLLPLLVRGPGQRAGALRPGRAAVRRHARRRPAVRAGQAVPVAGRLAQRRGGADHSAADAAVGQPGRDRSANGRRRQRPAAGRRLGAHRERRRRLPLPGPGRGAAPGGGEARRRPPGALGPSRAGARMVSRGEGELLRVASPQPTIAPAHRKCIRGGGHLGTPQPARGACSRGSRVRRSRRRPLRRCRKPPPLALRHAPRPPCLQRCSPPPWPPTACAQTPDVSRLRPCAFCASNKCTTFLSIR